MMSKTKVLSAILPLALLFALLAPLHSAGAEKERNAIDTTKERGIEPAIVPAPAGYDAYRDDIPHGKLETVTYPSKTVGNDRRAVVYTPPGYSPNKK